MAFDLRDNLTPAPRLPAVTVRGTGLATMPDGTKLGILDIVRDSATGELAAHIMIAPGGGSEHLGWVQVGTPVTTPSGTLVVSQITDYDEGGPRVAFTPASPASDSA